MSERLDRALVSRGLVKSRNQGREFILDGLVRVDGATVRRPAVTVAPEQTLALDPAASEHRVGRGYDKLSRFLSVHPVEFEARGVVDGGACTGGFTQVALERGAAWVLAVELGEGQLDPSLAAEPRVTSLEKTDLLTLETLPAPCDVLLLDLSFTSLKSILPALRLPLAEGARMIALVKPQFEAPAKALTAAGRLRDASVATRLVEAVLDCARTEGWEILATEPVALGPDQRQEETFVLARRAQ